MAMLALATADSPKMFVSTVELEAPSRPYTIETLGRLRTELQPARLFFVMGADSFGDVTSWREYEAILSEYDVVVVTRPGYPDHDASDGAQNGDEAVEALAPQISRRIVDLRGGAYPSNEDLKSPRIYLTDYVSIDVSATGIREAARQGLPIDGLVPATVAAYIEKYRLYQKS
jgi:nicotinate-nucleotide adenylyltransferase